MSASTPPKTIFVVGLFPDKNSVFIDELSQHFRVIMFKAQFFSTEHNSAIEFAEDILDSTGVDFDWQHFSWEMFQFVLQTQSKLKEIMPGVEKSALSREEFYTLYNVVFQINYLAVLFTQLANKTGIDLVISNADCSAIRRCIVIQAKALGIPTLDIEHGFNYSLMPEPELLKHDFVPYPMFISDYVNLENKLEVEKWQSYFDFSGRTPAPVFLAFGTPNNLTSEICLSKKQARRKLKLNPGKLTITITGTWNEARDVSVVLDNLINEVEFYQRVFTVLAGLKVHTDLQVLIKLHPAYSSPEIFNGCRNYLQHLAADTGLEIAHITHGELSEILSASDLLICPADSSIIWEAFCVSAPSIIFLTSDFLQRFFDYSKLNQSNVLAKHGWLKYVFSEDELEESIVKFINPATVRDRENSRQVIHREFEIEWLSVEEKSRRLIKWIGDLLDQNIINKNQDDNQDQTNLRSTEKISGIRPDVYGIYLTFNCPACGHSFENFQPTIMGLAFGQHVCPDCSQTLEVKTEEFEIAVNAYFPSFTMAEIDKINDEATRIVETWHRIEFFKNALQYCGVNVGEPAESELLPHVVRGILPD